ncbi:SETMR methyltransferase, partial [Acromyrmex heyeri]
MASQSCTPSAVPVPSSASNDSDTDKSNNGSFEIISDTELVLQDNQPQEQINVQIVGETAQYNKQQINQQIIQAQQQQASNSPSLKPILKQSTDDSSDTDDNFDTVDMYGGDVNCENMDVNLPAVVEQTTPIISHPCMPPAVPAPCSTNNDSDVDSYSDLDDIYNIDDIYDGIMDDMYDGNVNLENMDVNSTVVEQITPITSHPCMPPAVPTPSSTDNNFDTNSKSDTDNNYGGNVNLENMDVNSQDAQQSLPQSNYSDTDDNYGGNVDLENMDVNSQDAQSLSQLKLILKQLDSTLKQLNSILNPSTASTQPTIEQTTSISSQPCMPPPILAPNVANNSNMNVNPEKIDIDFEGAQLRLQKKQCNSAKIKDAKIKLAKQALLKLYNEVYLDGAPAPPAFRMVKKWFTRFRRGDFNLEDESPLSVIDDDAINSKQCTHFEEVAEALNIDRSTACRSLKKIKTIFMLRRLEKEVPLDRLVADEKWILYTNVKRKHIWKEANEPANSIAKAELPEKILLCFHLPVGQTIDLKKYCQQLTKVTILVRRGVIFHHDNARLYSSKMTLDQLKQLKWEILLHPPYSPDIAPSDFYLFRSLQND